MDPEQLTIRLAKDVYGVDLLPEQCTSRKAVAILGDRYKAIGRLIESTDLIHSCSISSGLKEAVDDWRSRGHLPFVMSTLPRRYVRHALSFMRANGVSIDGGWVLAEGYGKHELVKRWLLDILIDDDPYTVSEALKAGLEAVLFDRPCNRDADPSLPRMYGWADRGRYGL